MSKYLESSIFLDYMLELQEAQQTCRSMPEFWFPIGLSIRFILPRNYRVAYTLKYVLKRKKPATK